MENREYSFRAKYITVLVEVALFIRNSFLLFLILLGEPIIIFFLVVLRFIGGSVSWYFKKVTIKDEEFSYSSGILFKKSTKIHKDRLKAMDISKSILGRMFSYSVLNIETAVMDKKVGPSTITIRVSDKDIEIIKQYLLLAHIEDEDKEVLLEDSTQAVTKSNDDSIKYSYIATKKELFFHGFTSAGVVIWLFGLSQAYFFLDDIGLKNHANNIITTTGEKMEGTGILALIGLTIVFFILLNILVGIFYVIKLHGFRVDISKHNVNIKYGFFNIREFSFERKKINAVISNANIFRQVCGVKEINLLVKGYTGIGNQTIILNPLIKSSKINNFLSEILDDFVISEERERFEKGKVFFILKPIVCNFIVSIVLMILFKNKFFVLYNFLSVFNLIGRMLIIKNTSLAYNNRYVIATSGGFYVEEKRFRTKSIQTLIAKESGVLRRLKVANISIYYYSETGGGICTRHMKKENLYKLNSLLKINAYNRGEVTNENKQNKRYENIRQS
ncbi:MAG: PH domain-containing protein [Sarcina sp.]